jgi:hypothetical protein
MLKVFVYDHGWDGAVLFISADRKTAIDHFREEDISRLKASIAQHDVKKSGRHFVDQQNAQLDRIMKADYYDFISEYDCEEGTIFYTDGE